MGIQTALSPLDLFRRRRYRSFFDPCRGVGESG